MRTSPGTSVAFRVYSTLTLTIGRGRENAKNDASRKLPRLLEAPGSTISTRGRARRPPEFVETQLSHSLGHFAISPSGSARVFFKPPFSLTVSHLSLFAYLSQQHDFLRRRGRLGGLCPLFALHLVDGAHQQEHSEGDDDEAEARVDEDAVVEGNGARFLGRIHGEVGPAVAPSLSTTKRFEKSTLPSASPIGGMIRSFTRESTILPNAAPI